MMSPAFWTAIISGVVFCLYFAIFYALWAILDKWLPIFATYDRKNKAAWVERSLSTMFSTFASVTLLFALIAFFGFGAHDVFRILCDLVFSVAVGHFAADTVQLFIYREDQWPIFVAHHVIALVPYAIRNFVPACYADHHSVLDVGLALFLQVEWTTPSLNMVAFLRQLEQQVSRRYGFFFYFTYVLWIPTRLLLPLYLGYYMFGVVFPVWGWSACVVVDYAAGLLIILFCWAAFFTVLTPELLARRRGTADYQQRAASRVASSSPGPPAPRSPDDSSSCDPMRAVTTEEEDGPDVGVYHRLSA